MWLGGALGLAYASSGYNAQNVEPSRQIRRAQIYILLAPFQVFRRYVSFSRDASLLLHRRIFQLLSGFPRTLDYLLRTDLRKRSVCLRRLLLDALFPGAGPGFRLW